MPPFLLPSLSHRKLCGDTRQLSTSRPQAELQGLGGGLPPDMRHVSQTVCGNALMPMNRPQLKVPDSESRKSPPKATGGPSFIPQQAQRRGGMKAGYNKPRRRNDQHQPFKVMHWNADGVFNKKTELEYILYEHDINVCCIREN
ncbi:hypothetical protein DPMN_035700 [Dreissena polymorpha]|uniref:Uncharacterized protein n=1 Tax=Dreissena polymorpha TaxID=45954 RepID=A0A9D4MB44_DREPO|nr:hypothetical protein DPMN_035700 [Dreissena polymorpha]